MNESTSALPKTIALHNEGKLAYASLPYNTRNSAFSKTTLHYEGKLTHASLLYFIKERTGTCPCPTTTLHGEGKHKCITKNNIVL
jgi:hypothetical protein